MGRTRGPGIYGPYEHGNRWRVDLRSGEGETRHESFATREAALKFRRDLLAEWEAGGRTIETAINEYEKHLGNKGNKSNSVKLTVYRLKVFFEDDLDAPLSDLTPARGRQLYRALQARPAMRPAPGGKLVPTEKRLSVDTQRNTLAEARSFVEWCRAEGWVRANFLEGVKGEGRRRHGKAQLRVDEARKWLARAIELAPDEPGAVAALCTVLLGMRASEITSRVVRDLDDGGRLLWIPDAKTEAGKRTLEVPDEVETTPADGTKVVEGFPLRKLLLGLAEGKSGEALLFGKHWRDWPREWVQRICRDVGVPEVTAHGMRGLRATLGVLGGIGLALRRTADTLGHESPTTTTQSYVAHGAMEDAEQRAALKVLQGGKK